MEVRIKSNNLFKEDPANISMPQHEGDVGYDLTSLHMWVMPPHSVIRIHTGAHMELPEGIWAEIKDRSSMAAEGIFVHGGVIDTGYRGEIMVLLYNGLDKQQVIKPFQKIAQVVFRIAVMPSLLLVDDFDTNTERGERGFGSTGE